jgi:hypothetical protein
MTTDLPRLDTPNYFTGRRLTARTLNHDFAAERERRWFHNRALHGTGISSGLTVTGEIGGAVVEVEPGHAIDPEGRDLILTERRILQVPARSGTTDTDGTITPDRYVLVCRWSDDPPAIGATGPCRADGVAGWSEAPVLEFVAEDEVRGVALATVDVFACALHALGLGRRRVLGERKLPHVDGGRVLASMMEWRILATEDDPAVIFGLEATVDTSVAGFGAVPSYQARVSGLRSATLPNGTSYRFWTADAYVTDQGSSTLTFQVLVPTVHVIEGSATVERSLQEFLDDHGMDEGDLIALVGDTLGWGVTWIGVEGSL